MNEYQVKRIDCKTAKDYIRKNHYTVLYSDGYKSNPNRAERRGKK